MVGLHWRLAGDIEEERKFIARIAEEISGAE